MVNDNVESITTFRYEAHRLGIIISKSCFYNLSNEITVGFFFFFDSQDYKMLTNTLKII